MCFSLSLSLSPYISIYIYIYIILYIYICTCTYTCIYPSIEPPPEKDVLRVERQKIIVEEREAKNKEYDILRRHIVNSN